MGILDTIFPKKCVGCFSIGEYWCEQCRQQAKLQFPQVCPLCERNSIEGRRHPYCKASYTPDGLLSIWVYEGTFKKLLSKIKYKFVSDAVSSIAKPAIFYIKETPLAQVNGILVSIPLHWKRKNWRGFNQTEAIGTAIARGMGWKTAPLITRVKKTDTQVGKTEKQRKENIQGVFSLNKAIKLPFNTQILLFDDVWTTGATMKEATRVIKEAGYKNVWCLTLAR